MRYVYAESNLFALRLGQLPTHFRAFFVVLVLRMGRKQVFRLLAVLLIVLGLTAGTVVPSQAAQRLVDVKGFSAPSVVFSKSGCEYITVKMRKSVHR